MAVMTNPASAGFVFCAAPVTSEKWGQINFFITINQTSLSSQKKLL